MRSYHSCVSITWSELCELFTFWFVLLWVCFVFCVCFCFFLMGFHYICISHTGKHPKQSKGTLVRVYDVEKLDPKQWGFRVLGIQGNEMTLAVQSAPDAIVGSWTVFANLGFQDDEGKQQTRRNKLHEKVTLLFNTWCGGKCGVVPRNGNVVTLMKFSSLAAVTKMSSKWHFRFYEDMGVNGGL